MSASKNKKQEKKTSPIKLELLITVVEKKKADFFADLIQSYNSNMQMKVLAKGAAKSDLLEYLGITATNKIALFSLIRQDKRDEIMDAMEEKFRTIKNGKGISVAIPLTSLIGKQVFGFLTGEKKFIEEN